MNTLFRHNKKNFYLTKLDFACIKRDYMQESYNPTDFFYR